MPNENDFEWLDEFGSSEPKAVDLNSIDNLVKFKSLEFIDEVTRQAINYKLVNTGTLTSEDGYRMEQSHENGLTTLEIFMVFYGLFQDRGVRGFVNDDNAPDSPYTFKHGKMSKDGLENIKKMISEGRAKISDTSKTKYLKVGFERKAKEPTMDPLDREAKQLAYLIKAYGIKTRPFFKTAYEKIFGKLDYELIERVKQEFVTRLKYKNKQ